MKKPRDVDVSRSGEQEITRTRWISVASVVSILAVWTLATNMGLISGKSLPTPQAILKALWEFITVGYRGKSFLDNVGHSIFRAMAGLTLGVAMGVPLGLLMGYHPRLNAVFSPIIGFLRPIPSLAFIPLVILYLGIGEPSKIAVIWLAAFLYMTLYAATGVRNVKRDYVLLGRNLELSQWQLFRTVIFPASLPYIIAGLKTATALSWAIVVAAELIAAQSGLGYMIMDASTFFNLPSVCVGMLFIGGIGLLLELGTNLIERNVLHWSCY
jgi:NitT/TauT family transport system permease protein